ncbi:cytochrome P450 CYP82D47-like [Papaver somniferum]|uniref:cytochrome P450 CYP82D47-like n=1 Tax=Papaver somniferum TaxID=3469 RepID=UPI000E6F9E70|nr:cytochrome P450 CYP82D47-like [Papaver somniferum]XP_026439558.1 cytochrome P450 CYP82D47-like [Papaver somniferum]
MMDLTTFMDQYLSLARIAGLLAMLSLFYYSWITVIRSSRNTKLSPPEVAGAWPILGHLPQLLGSRPLFKILTDMSDNYGPIFMVRFGMHPTLVVSSWEMAKECFTTNDKFLAGRPSGAANKYLTFGLFGFSTYGPYWRELRKISTLHLLSHRRVQLFKHVPYLEIGNCMKHLHRRWMRSPNKMKQNDTAAGSVKVDMSQLFGELTLNVVLNLVAGKSIFFKNDNNHEYESKDGPNKEEEEGQKLHKTIIEFFILTGTSVASDALPFLGWLDVDGQKKRMKRVAKDMDFIVAKWLEEHRHQRRQTILSSSAAGGSNHDDAKDFMDVLMSVLDGENNELFFGYSRDTVIKKTCLQMIIAASDTTSLTLTWALALLITNPTVLRKAQDELETKVGKDRNLEEHDINDLVYLQAIVKETFRMYAAAPLDVPHEAIVDCNIGGYKVRAGTRLMVNLWKMHRDPRVWSKPLEFKPERFLAQPDSGSGGEAANLDFRGQNFEYLPFGSGRRMCPGIDFALQTVHMALDRLLHAFDFDNDSAGLVTDMTEGSGLTMPKLTPLEIYLRPRLPAKLY